MSLTREILEALKTELETVLTTANTVKLAYSDERVDTEDRSAYPIVTMQCYDIAIDSDRRHSGTLGTVVDNGDGTVTITSHEVPINYYFQVDILTLKFDDDWDLTEAFMRMIGSQWRRITAATSDLYLYLIPMDGPINLAAVEGFEVHRKAFRFYIQAELPTGKASVTEPKLQTITLSANNTEASQSV